MDPLDLVKAYLSEETERSWLMILDGADNLDSLDLNPQTSVSGGKLRCRKMMMDCLPSGPLGAILATTCDRVSARELANNQTGDMLEVKAFTHEEGLAFVRTKLAPERISDPHVFELLKIIHSVPIALAQAVAYLVHCPETTATEYLISLASNTSKSTIAKSGFSIPSDGPPTTHSGILATTKVSLKHIQNKNSPCVFLSEIISMFNFQNIPVSLLRHFDEKANGFRDLLTDFALINVPTDRTQVIMNPLIKSSIKDLAIDKNTLSSEILMVLSRSFPSVRPGRTEFSQSCETLLPYAEAALKLKSSSSTKRDLSYRATLLFNTARYNAHLKRYELAMEALKESIQLRERESGKDSESVIEVKTVLENIERKAKSSNRTATNATKPKPQKADGCLEITRRMANPKQQKEVEKELVKQLQILKTQGQEDGEEGMKIEDGLAILYDTIGQHENSIARHEKVLEWCKIKYGLNGADDLHTYRQIYKVALNLDLRGMHEEAEAKYLEALTGTERRLGKGHPEVSRILCNLATVYGIQGKTKEAKETFEEVIKLQSRRPGVQHPEFLMTKHNFAVFLQGQNNLDAADNMLRKVLEDQERILGSDHPDTLRTAINLAKNFWLKGEDETAIAICRLVLPRQVEAVPSDHADYKATKDLMAMIERTG